MIFLKPKFTLSRRIIYWTDDWWPYVWAGRLILWFVILSARSVNSLLIDTNLTVRFQPRWSSLRWRSTT